MGKFFDALKKSEGLKTKVTPAPTSEKVLKISPEKIDTLKLETVTPRGPEETSPIAKVQLDPRLASFMEPHSVASECFKLLRAKILKPHSGSRPRSIMVTSAQPLDGKTTVAVNLAISIAQGINEYVVLLDCDLRRSAIGRLLGLSAPKGIREYLEEGTSVGPYLIRTPVKKLTMLPAGKPPPNPSELLSSEKMRRLVQELKSRYEDRYLIFDTTPAQFGAETSFLASMVDKVLLVVRPGRTSRDALLEAIGNIGRERIIGVVLNACKETPKGYGYYDRYYRDARGHGGIRPSQASIDNMLTV
jgi:capsular exopolysaccharide synthesis family protein